MACPFCHFLNDKQVPTIIIAPDLKLSLLQYLGFRLSIWCSLRWWCERLGELSFHRYAAIQYIKCPASKPSIAKEVGWGQEGQLWLAQMRRNTEQCGKVQPYFRPFQQVYVVPPRHKALSPKQIALDSLASKPESVVAQHEVQSSNNCRRLQHIDSSGAQNWTAKFQGSPNLEFEFSIV